MGGDQIFALKNKQAIHLVEKIQFLSFYLFLYSLT